MQIPGAASDAPISAEDAAQMDSLYNLMQRSMSQNESVKVIKELEDITEDSGATVSFVAELKTFESEIEINWYTCSKN